MPYTACTKHNAVIIKQTGKIKLLNGIFFFEKRLNKAKYINIAEEENVKQYHLGAVCALTKKELLKNRVHKQSKKKNNTKILKNIFMPQN